MEPVLNPYDKFPQLNCIEKSQIMEEELVENCELYVMVSFGYYGCNKCIDGYYGPVNDGGTISQCYDM